MQNAIIKQHAYFFPTLLIGSIILGGFTGYFFGDVTERLRPFGELFLNLILTIVVPLIFFSLSTAVSRVGSLKKLRRLFVSMILIFTFTGMVAAGLSIIIVKIFPITSDIRVPLVKSNPTDQVIFYQKITDLFTVPEFSKLLSHEHMLALIVFSLLVGFAVSSLKDKGSKIVTFLQTGEELTMRLFNLIMYYAPIGFFAYFAVLMSNLGTTLANDYLRTTIIYYTFTFSYFLIAFTIYAYFSGRKAGVQSFWRHVFLPMITAIATCSSAASIPANLSAAKKIQIPAEVYETSIPLGSIIHKDGSVIGGLLKIAFLFSVLHLNFSGVHVILTALGVSILVGTVMGAIPSGGMLGELLILSVYGLSPSLLFLIAPISIIIDPLATMVNVTGNTVSSMMIARLVVGKHWLTRSCRQKKVKSLND